MRRRHRGPAVATLAIVVAGCSVSASPARLSPAAPSAGSEASAPTIVASPSPTVAPATPNPTIAAAIGHLVFQSNRVSGRSLYVVGADGSGLHAVPISVQAGAPAWAPDGRRIAFTWDQLFVVDSDGSGLTRLSHQTGRQLDVPAWSPDGRRLAYLSHGAGGDVGDMRLEILDLDTGAVAVTAANPSGDRPDWSPDGKTIVYGNADNGGLASLDLRTGVVTRLTSFDDGMAAFSPDGRWLAFERGGEPTAAGTQIHHILIARADGTDERQLTTTSLDDEYPSWSPDGAWIAFSRLDGVGGGTIWRVTADGDEERITGDGFQDSFADWGP